MYSLEKKSSKRWLPQKKNFINFSLGFESVDKLPEINSRALGNACASFGKEKTEMCVCMCRVCTKQNNLDGSFHELANKRTF